MSLGFSTTARVLPGALLLLVGLALGGCQDAPYSQPPGPSLPEPTSLPRIEPESSRELREFFTSLGYDWPNLDQGVPPFILGSFPQDLGRLRRVEEKKRLFFLGLLPMVLLENRVIAHQREHLEELLSRLEQGDLLDPEEVNWLGALARDYELEADLLANSAARLTLLKRVDVIPPSMALAQAASESAYGTSRFARQGNNLFGEWTFVQGAGLVPKDRVPGLTHEVRKFPTLFDSVRSYMRNLNTHYAYLPFREKRARLRSQGLPLRGLSLADGLLLYSTRGEAYVRDIRSIIRYNRLSLLSSAELRTRKYSRESHERTVGAGLLSSALFVTRHPHQDQSKAD